MEKLLSLQNNVVFRLALAAAGRNGHLQRRYLTSVSQTLSGRQGRFHNGPEKGSSVLVDELTEDFIPSGCTNPFQSCRWRKFHNSVSLRTHPLNLGEICQFKKEWKATVALLSRSFPESGGILNQLLHIKHGEVCRNFSSSSKNSQQQPQQHDDDQDKDKDPDEDERMPLRTAVVLGLLVILGVLLFDRHSLQPTFVSWNEFIHEMLAKGEVKELIVYPESNWMQIQLHPGAVVKNRKASDQCFMHIPDIIKIEERIRAVENELGIKPDDGVAITYSRLKNYGMMVFAATMIIVFSYLYFRTVKFQIPNDVMGGVGKAKFTRVDLMTQQGKGITFKDVAGLQEAKIEVMEFVDYLKRPEKYVDLGGRIPCGALLLGPPGCGKTLLAKAVANEAKVPFLAMAGSEFVEMIGGLGAARVRDLFKQARQKAPCIVYIDEIDAIGRRREGDNWAHNTEEEHTLNQLLVEMDGMDTKEGVIMLASTNRHEVLDKALLRPGRFDRHIMIDFPTLVERKEIFEIYLSQLSLRGIPQHYSEKLSQLSPGMSGADIANICNEAALHAARDQKKAVDHNDFDYAVERVVAGVAKKSRILSPQEKKVVAYHEAGHALVGWLLEHTDAMLRVSIVPRTNAALGFAQYLPSDKKLISKEELFERMCMALGGRVSEALIFNNVTSGAQDDLNKVTKMAYDQVKFLGMSDHVGQVSFPREESSFASKPYSKKLAYTIDMESKQLVAQAYKHTENLLKNNKEKLRVIAEALLEKECLTYADMEQLVGPPPYGRKHNANMDWGPPDSPAAPTS